MFQVGKRVFQRVEILKGGPLISRQISEIVSESLRLPPEYLTPPAEKIAAHASDCILNPVFIQRQQPPGEGPERCQTDEYQSRRGRWVCSPKESGELGGGFGRERPYK